MRDAGDRGRSERYTVLPAPVEPEVWRCAGPVAPSSCFFLWGGALRPESPGDRAPFGLDPDSREARGFRARRSAAALAWARSGAEADLEEEADDDSTLSVCCTALFDRTRRESDPGRYVETTELPFLTLGTRKAFRETGIRLGDLATVVHPMSGRYLHAIVGDAREVVGAEPSMFLADRLGLGAGDPALYLIHPESGQGQGTIPSADQIARRGERLFRRSAWPGGPSWDLVLRDCFADVLRADILPVEARDASGARACGA